MTDHYLHSGIITKQDITHALYTIVTERAYPDHGWKLTTRVNPDITLSDLATLWAEQENECAPEDRMTFTAWLDSHIGDDTIEEPYEVAVRHYQCPTCGQPVTPASDNKHYAYCTQCKTMYQRGELAERTQSVQPETVPYKVYTRTTILEQRIMYAPKGLTYQQALNYCHQNGCDTLADATADGGYAILDIRDQDDSKLPDSDPMPQTYTAIREVTTRQHIEFDAPGGMSLQEAYDWFMEQNDPDTVIGYAGDEEVVDEQIEVTGTVE